MIICIPQLTEDNQGGTQIVETDAIDIESADQHNETIDTVLLDDLVPFIPFKKAVMKIDIEGHEHKALSKAEELFNKVKIPYIYMEWTFLKSFKGEASEDFALVKTLRKNLHSKGYLPFQVVPNNLEMSELTIR